MNDRRVIVQAARDLALEVRTSGELVTDGDVVSRVAGRTGLTLTEEDCHVAVRYFDARWDELETSMPSRDSY